MFSNPTTPLFFSRHEAHDRAEQARRNLKRKGLTYEDRFGQPRGRPEVRIELENRRAFAKLLNQIDLYVPEWWSER
jgi:hypothetical protein